MKKLILLLFLLPTIAFGQTTAVSYELLSENFDSYNSGDNVRIVSPLFTKAYQWSEDAFISNTLSYSTPNSLHLENKDTFIKHEFTEELTCGLYYYEFMLYVENGFALYFSTLPYEMFGIKILGNVAMGNVWANDSIPITFSFNHSTWNKIRFEVDLDENIKRFYLNDIMVVVEEWDGNWKGLRFAGSDYYLNTGNSYVDDISFGLLGQQTAIPDTSFEKALKYLDYDCGSLNGYVRTSIIATIEYLPIGSNNITDLTGIEAFTGLADLRCGVNQISSLDLSNNTALSKLDCFLNDLTELNLSNNTSLASLDCRNNQLNCLNVKNGNNTNMTFFNSTNNSNLNCIEVDDTTIASSWTNIDSHTSYSTDCNNECSFEDSGFDWSVCGRYLNSCVDEYNGNGNLTLLILSYV